MEEVYNGCEDVNINNNEMEIEDTSTQNGELEDGDIVIPGELPDTAPNDTAPHIEVDDDPLAAPMKQFEELQQRAEDVEREENGDVEEARNGRKLCATRHGCQGATDCNYSYGSYPG